MRRARFTLAALLIAGGALVVGASSARAADINITYANNAWSPNPATAHVGDHLHFCNGSDAAITVAIESFTLGPIDPRGCEGDLVVEASDAELGALSYHCVEGCSANGVIMVQDSPATTAPPTPSTTPSPPTATAATRAPTATPTRRATAAARPASPSLDTTTSVEDTTTTFFDTSTSEFTTTTLGGFAILEEGGERAGANGTAVAVLAALVLIGGGGGYFVWRNRFRYQ